MKKICYLLLFSSFLFAQCRKEGTLYTEHPITGTLLYTDSTEFTYENKILGNTYVYLTDDTTANFSKYLYKVKSDSTGKFIFSHTPDDSKQLFIYSLGSVNSKSYTGFSEVNKDSAKQLILKAIPVTTLNYNLLLFAKDNDLHSPLNNILLYAFSNRLFAIRDTANKNGAGNIFNGHTDNYGRTTINNLITGRYYFTIHDSIAGIRFRTLDSIDFAPVAIAPEKTIYAEKF